jgi:hypothetical protein
VACVLITLALVGAFAFIIWGWNDHHELSHIHSIAFRDFSTLSCTSVSMSSACQEGGDVQWFSGPLKAADEDVVIGSTEGFCITVEPRPATNEFLQECEQIYEFSDGTIKASGPFLETSSPDPYAYRVEHWTINGGTGAYANIALGWIDSSTTADSYLAQGQFTLLVPDDHHH